VVIGFLHIGDSRHGVVRYGQSLAKTLEDLAERVVVESVPTDDQGETPALLREAALRLCGCDVVHIQFSPYSEMLWGTGVRGVRNLRVLLDNCNSPVVCTGHDLNELVAPLTLGNRATEVSGSNNGHPSALSRWRNIAERAVEWLFRLATAVWLFRRVALVLCLTKAEAKVATRLIWPARAQVIPLPIESPGHVAHLIARRELEKGDQKIVIMLGYVTPTKGHDAALEALRYLPEVHFVIIGSAPLDQPWLEDSIRQQIRENTLTERVTLTGYVEEEQMQRYVRAADLALCPYAAWKSASSSLTTLLSLDCPVLATEAPCVTELNEMAPGSIRSFRWTGAQAMAAEIRAALQTDRDQILTNQSRLKEILAPTTIAARHLLSYERLINGEVSE
jgi:glycosyltransferase involved in cell wall biosynthesis